LLRSVTIKDVQTGHPGDLGLNAPELVGVAREEGFANALIQTVAKQIVIPALEIVRSQRVATMTNVLIGQNGQIGLPAQRHVEVV